MLPQLRFCSLACPYAKLNALKPLHAHAQNRACCHFAVLGTKAKLMLAAQLMTGLFDNREKYMRFGLEGGKSVILDRVQATTDGPIILKQHAITFDRSADLQPATDDSAIAEQPGSKALHFHTDSAWSTSGAASQKCQGVDDMALVPRSYDVVKS